MYNSASEDVENVYWPFKSRTDWLVARWVKLRGPGSNAVSELLRIPGVSIFLKICAHMQLIQV